MPRQARCPWTADEDAIITELVVLHEHQWSKVAQDLKERLGVLSSGKVRVRTGKQCRERWHNHLNPDVNKEAWTSEEDAILEAAHQRLGLVLFFGFYFIIIRFLYYSFLFLL